MRIECYISHGCDSFEQLRLNISRALLEMGIDAEAYYFRISDAEAAALNLAGSPTVLVNGADAFPGGTPGFA